MHVLLAGYQCDATAGAEARGAVAWIAGLAAAGVRLTVLTRTEPAAVSPVLAGLSGVDVVSLPGTGRRSLTDETALRRDYLRWHRAVRAWLATRPLSGFDLAHHLSWGSVTAPTALALAGSLPLVWGPVGGGQHCPFGLVRLMRPVAAGREAARTFRLRAARWLPWVRRAAESAAVALATNGETARLLRRLGARRVWPMPDTALPELPEPPSRPDTHHGSPRLVWMGRLEPHKAPVTAVRALRLLPDRATLDLVGTGSEFHRIREEVQASGLSGRVRMHGQLTHADALAVLAGASATLFTSLRDSYGPVILESLAQGVPVVALGHQGVLGHPPDLVRRVPVGPAAGLPAGFATEVATLLHAGPTSRQALAARCRDYVRQEHLWPHRVDDMCRAYRAALR